MWKLLESSGSFCVQCKLLDSFLSMPQLKEHREKLQLNKEYDELKIKSFDNLAKIVSHTSAKKKGNTASDKQIFQESVIASILDTVSQDIIQQSNSSGRTYFSMSKQSQNTQKLAVTFGISQRTMRRKIGKALKKRHHIITSASSKDIFKIPKRRGHSRITSALKHKLDQWIYNHHNSHKRDTIKVKIPGTKGRETVPKYYLQVPVRELHADLIKHPDEGGLLEARDEKGKVLIIDTRLRLLLPHNVKLMGNQRRNLCNCEICFTSDL